jgi:rhodanese-related sulfurtransferase
VIGLDAVAVPLAGAAGVPLLRFLIFDTLGALFWSVTYTALGYLFSNQLDRVAAHLVGMGTVVLVAAAAAVSFHLGRKFAQWQRFVRQFKLARITPEQLRHKLNGGEDILIVDLQGRVGPATEPMAVPGAVCINPRRLEQYKDVEISPSQEVVLYCASPSEFTSARVALALREKGVLHVRPPAGALQARCDCGFPTTSEVRVLQIPVATS